MNASINLQRLIPIYLACLCIALIPSLFIYYLILTALCIKTFVVVCIIDYFLRSSMRKNFGLVLAIMILAAITSLLAFYVLNIR